MTLTLPLDRWQPLLALGSRGEDVQALQRYLIDEGYDVGRAGADGAYGTQTHNAVVAWQRARGWQGADVTGSVGPSERSALALDMAPRAVPPVLAPQSLTQLEFVGAKNWSRNVGPQPKRWLVLHSMEMAEASTTAERCAEYFAGQPPHSEKTPGTSAHACIDDDSIIQCVAWDRVAWHAPGANQWGIGLEHAGYARQSTSQWLDDYGRRMLGLSSWLCQALAAQFGIPLQIADPEMLVAGEPGITTHAFVTQAFKKGDHTDPGLEFPLAWYLQACRNWRVR